VILPLFGLCALLAADPPASMIAGDEAFFSIDYPAAVASYDANLAAAAADPQLLWRLARVNVCMGEVAEGTARDSLFLAAERWARMCIAAGPNVPEGHTWLAGALGYLALDAPVKRQLSLTRELLRETERALELNPNDDIAYSIRGSCFRALGNVGWLQRQIASIVYGGVPDGGYPEAEAALKRAIAIAPTVKRHAYELGVLYIDWGKKEEAVSVLRHAATLPIQSAIDRPRQAKILELLAGLEEKR